MKYEERINRLKGKRREIESTDVFKISRAKKKKMTKEKYKLNGNENCLHDYAAADDDDPSEESNNKIKKEKQSQQNQTHLMSQKLNNGYLKP